MGLIIKRSTKVSGTTDKKKLKKESKSYTYGTISIRTPDLTQYIGQDVEVRIYDKKKKGAKK